jgi:hypothetical protein
MMRRKIAKISSVVGIVITVTATVFAAITIMGDWRGSSQGGRFLDMGTYIASLTYLFATAPASILGLVLGDRKSVLVRANYLVLGLWVIILLLMVTTTGRAPTLR